MEKYQDAVYLAPRAGSHNPLFSACPDAAASAAAWFRAHFSGKTFFAIKANPAPWLLKAVHDAGIHQFEVASITEVRLVRELFAAAEIAFMHPVKATEAIREAYFDHGVRIFALDCESEFDKILSATDHAEDLSLCLRHKVSSEHARISLAQKFGAEGELAVRLLRRMRHKADRLGVSFHVGSQTMSPQAYIAAMDLVEETIVKAGVIVDILDVGGGFPVSYPGMEAPPLTGFVRAIEARFEKMLVAENCALWCEPGRAICAEAATLTVRVEKRDGNNLYINEGVYGALFDAGHLNWRYPVSVTPDISRSAPLAAFSFYGPSCDDIDFMEGPFFLPADITIGDTIRIEKMGAYGLALRSGFNGFGEYEEVLIEGGQTDLTQIAQEQKEQG